MARHFPTIRGICEICGEKSEQFGSYVPNLSAALALIQPIPIFKRGVREERGVQSIQSTADGAEGAGGGGARSTGAEIHSIDLPYLHFPSIRGIGGIFG